MDWNTNNRSTVSTQGLPPFPRCFSRLVDTDAMNNNNVTSYQQESERIPREKLENLCKEKILSHFDVSPEDNDMDQKQWRNSSLCKLNLALVRLRSEMACLRHLDLNLLCQLWSLSDAIQDYKFTLQDRHSESNSECSSNFCWTDSFASFDDFDSTDDHLADTCSIGRSDSFCGSTSSLWQQINELKEKAETDFTIGV
ncbi:protein FAM89A isoform X1 [Octopus sinensis]|uniref:Protein FAM89A isoform X1 n=2 Tax=Octopus sinensis TaxID=2607531 RepID=A0A6P7SWU3_9MOLL|nr:protein FAM89A isoform X1 [Octopus sinensis]